MSGEWAHIKASDGSGSFRAYMAKPKGGDGPAVIAIQEIFGINEGMREICDRLSQAGFTAIAPDLFWRQEPGIELTDKTDAEWAKAFKLYKGFNVDKGIEDIRATIAYAREQGADKVGAVGYCLGGLLAYLTATRSDADACVGYYGVGIHDHLEEARNITKPVLLHIAGADEFVPAEAQKKMHQGLDSHPHVTLYDYPGQNHAFARPDGIHFDANSASAANKRTFDFFKKNLG